MNSADVLIIGGGVSGLSCALYTSKAKLNTVILNHGDSQLKSVKLIHNLPGQREPISGEDWLHAATKQIESHGATIHNAQVESLSLYSRPYTVVTVDGAKWTAKYLVLAVNLGYPLLESAGFDIAINEHVPSRKIRKLTGVGYDGQTEFAGVYVTGLLADVPSQTIIASGHGAFVGIQIASDSLDRPFMWHD